MAFVNEFFLISNAILLIAFDTLIINSKLKKTPLSE